MSTNKDLIAKKFALKDEMNNQLDKLRIIEDAQHDKTKTPFTFLIFLLAINAGILGVTFYLSPQIIVASMLLAFGVIVTYTLQLGLHNVQSSVADQISNKLAIKNELKIGNINLRKLNLGEKIDNVKYLEYEPNKVVYLLRTFLADLFNWMSLSIAAMIFGLFGVFIYTVLNWFEERNVGGLVLDTRTEKFLIFFGVCFTILIVYILIRLLEWYVRMFLTYYQEYLQYTSLYDTKPQVKTKQPEK